LGGAFAEPKTFTVGGDNSGNGEDPGNGENPGNGEDPGNSTGVDETSSYAPKVYTVGKKVIVEGNDGSIQSLNVYTTSGARLVSTTFAGSTEVELSMEGIYIVELTKTNAAPFRKKVLVK
jgi:hypothetical protein